MSSMKNNQNLLEPDEELQYNNFDPYLRYIDKEPDPQEVTKRSSLWSTFLHLLFPFHK